MSIDGLRAYNLIRAQNELEESLKKVVNNVMKVYFVAKPPQLRWLSCKNAPIGRHG